MRKAILVLALVAAAFAGGAVANGKGLAWAQVLLQQIRLPNGDLNTVVVGDPAHPAQGGTEPTVEPIPAAPLPPLVITPTPGAAAATPQNSASAATPQNAASAAEPAPRVAQDSAGAPTLPGPAPRVAQDSAGAPTLPGPAARPEILKGAGPPEPPALGADPKMPAAPPTAPAASPPPDPLPLSREAVADASASPVKGRENGWSDAPGSAPAQAVLPPAPEPQEKKDSALARAALNTPSDERDANRALLAAPGSSWPELRRRMQELGVTRYWIEGEPTGPAVFRCVIPLAGRRAVSQLFEAEGDDDVQAAEAALRRVALWRATANP